MNILEPKKFYRLVVATYAHEQLRLPKIWKDDGCTEIGRLQPGKIFFVAGIQELPTPLISSQRVMAKIIVGELIGLIHPSMLFKYEEVGENSDEC